MSVSPTSSLAERAVALSAAVGRMPGVIGVCIFGSVARGDADAGSDIDVLVLSDGELLEPGRIRALLPEQLREAASFSVHDVDGLDDYLGAWSRFATHLQLEGWLTHDPTGTLSDLISRERPLSTETETKNGRRHLRLYARPERFGGHFLFPLAHLYRIGRAATYARLAEMGVLEYDAERAFEALASRSPQRRRDVEVVRRLAAFHDTVRHDRLRPLPFDPVGDDGLREFEVARRSVERLLGGEAGPAT